MNSEISHAQPSSSLFPLKFRQERLEQDIFNRPNKDDAPKGVILLRLKLLHCKSLFVSKHCIENRREISSKLT